MDAEVLRGGLEGDGAGEGTVGLRHALDVEVIEVGHEQVSHVVAEVDEEVWVVGSSRGRGRGRRGAWRVLRVVWVLGRRRRGRLRGGGPHGSVA